MDYILDDKEILEILKDENIDFLLSHVCDIDKLIDIINKL